MTQQLWNIFYGTPPYVATVRYKLEGFYFITVFASVGDKCCGLDVTTKNKNLLIDVLHISDGNELRSSDSVDATLDVGYRPRFTNDVAAEGTAIVGAELLLAVFSSNDGNRRTPQAPSLSNGTMIWHVLRTFSHDV